MSLRFCIHMILHVVAPGVAARVGWKTEWKRAWLLMLATQLVDLDHLMASPILDPRRCSLGFHPLHSWPAIAAYVLLAAVPKTRLVGVGLVLHMVLDGIDCLWMRCG